MTDTPVAVAIAVAMNRAREKFDYWRARNTAVASDLAAALERIDIKLTRHARAIASVADAIDGHGLKALANELRREAAALLKID